MSTNKEQDNKTAVEKFIQLRKKHPPIKISKDIDINELIKESYDHDYLYPKNQPKE